MFLAAATVHLSSAPVATFAVLLPTTLPRGEMITATATDQSGDTSEFSNCLTLRDAPLAPEATSLPGLGDGPPAAGSADRLLDAPQVLFPTAVEIGLGTSAAGQAPQDGAAGGATLSVVTQGVQPFGPADLTGNQQAGPNQATWMPRVFTAKPESAGASRRLSGVRAAEFPQVLPLEPGSDADDGSASA
jgi:hypothetical protein